MHLTCQTCAASGYTGRSYSGPETLPSAVQRIRSQIDVLQWVLVNDAVACFEV